MKNVFTLLAKIGLVPLGLTTAALETDAAIQKNLFRSGDPRSYLILESMVPEQPHW